MKKKEKEEANDNGCRFDCPVCGKKMIDFQNEDFQYLSNSCSHVVLSYSYAMQDFGEIDGSMEEAVVEMERRLNENEKREGDDDYEDISMIDLLVKYADKSNGQYALYSFEDPNNEPPVYETIYLLIRMKDEEVSTIDEKLQRQIDDYVDRGAKHAGREQYQLAIENYSAAIQLNPDYPGLYLNRGFAYEGLGNYELAIEDYNKALCQEPEYKSDIYYYRARCFSLQEKAQQACKWLRLAIDEGYTNYEQIKKDFDNIKSESCFIDLLTEYKMEL